MRTRLNFTRPNVTVPFFSLKLLPETQELHDLMLYMYEAEQAGVMSTTDELSEDSLKMVRTAAWKSEADKEAFNSGLKEKFGWFLEARAAYLEENNITMTSIVLQS